LPAVFGTIPRSAAVVVARARWRRWARPWLVVVAAAASAASASGNLALPNKSGSLKFAVVGDFGTGDPPSYETAAQMAAARSRFPFDMVLMVGDNIVGRQSDPSDFVGKFEQPFGPLLKSGVRFYGALGNHDKSANRFYPAWNMGGQRYYTFVRQDVRFFVLDSNRLDRQQLAWFEHELRASKESWTICHFHHPLYSDGVKHGPALELRVLLEPLLVRYGVDVVFAGHDHVYERFRPQKGVLHFVLGPGGQEPRTMRRSEETAASFEGEQNFMLVEVSRDALNFHAVSRTGAIVDSGSIRPRPKMQGVGP
jgi:predicted phosphodiesterase